MRKYNLLLSISLISLALVACGQDAQKTPEKTSVATKQVTTEKSTTATKTKVQHKEKQSQDKANNQVSETTHSQNKSENQDNTTDKQDKVATQGNESAKNTTVKDNQSAEAVKEETNASNEGAMDITAIQVGDFSSIAGTWVNGRGQVFVFTETGLVDDSHVIEPEYNRIDDNGNLTSSLRNIKGIGGAAIVFIPKGNKIGPASYEDPSDKTKDRIWAGQGLSQDDLSFLYKVD